MAFPSLDEGRSKSSQRAMPCLTIDSDRTQRCALHRGIRPTYLGVLAMRCAATERRKWCLFAAAKVFRDDSRVVFRLSPQVNTSRKQWDRALGALGALVSGFPMRARVNHDLQRKQRPKSVDFFLCAYWGLPSLASLASHLLFLAHIFQRVTK
jgi:hypothetical protein